MIIVGVIAAVAALAAGLTLLTFVACRVINSRHPPRGEFVDTPGGRLHVVALDSFDPTAAERPPLVLLHGAGANLEDLRFAIGEKLRRRFSITCPTIFCS